MEIRGSQGRVTLYYRNHSPSASSPLPSLAAGLEVALVDPAGLLRCQLAPLSTRSLASGQQMEQVLLMECMKPAHPPPSLRLQYNVSPSAPSSSSSSQGQWDVGVALPVCVASFNEPLPLSAQDFESRWGMLVGAGQECQEVFSPCNNDDGSTKAIVPEAVVGVLTHALKFAPPTMTGGEDSSGALADASEYVLYGAASLRTGALAAGGSGEKVSVGCMIKIEMNVQANAMRLTVR